MKDKLKFIIPIVVALVILIISVILLSQKNNNNATNNIQNTETVQPQTQNPASNAVITQGKLPTNSFIAAIPKITVGTIGDVIETANGTSINVLNIELQDYQNYISQTQEIGFVNNIDTTSTTNTILYSASNNNGLLLRTSYSTETKKMSLVIEKND